MNIRHVFFLSVMVLCLNAYTQNRVAQQVDSLKYVKDMPYLCGDGYLSGCATPVYWNVITLKDKAIPALIARLDDSTTTEASVSLFGFNYAVADIAYSALQEIIHHIPTLELAGLETNSGGCNYCAYWDFVRADYRNRIQFKKAVGRWYKRNKKRLVWVPGNTFQNCDCGSQHPNGGHYEVK